MSGARSWLTLGALCCTLGLGCTGGSSAPAPCSRGGDGCGPPVDPSVAEQLQALQGVAVYFGHNSVGGNVMEGLAAVLGAQPGPRPALVTSSSPGDVHAGAFAHSYLGGNGRPLEKIATFRTLMTGDLGASADVAFMKLCYVDVVGEAWDDAAAVDALLAAYRDMVAAVQAAHPDLKLLHVTVPLSPSNEIDNRRRERISQRLRDAYGADVFDLASIEAGGGHFSGSYGLYLNPAWAADASGHLDAEGSRAVALELVAFLAARL